MSLDGQHTVSALNVASALHQFWSICWLTVLKSVVRYASDQADARMQKDESIVKRCHELECGMLQRSTAVRMQTVHRLVPMLHTQEVFVSPS